MYYPCMTFVVYANPSHLNLWLFIMFFFLSVVEKTLQKVKEKFNNKLINKSLQNYNAIYDKEGLRVNRMPSRDGISWGINY